MLAPLDAVALRRPVAMAAQRKIPVVIFDSALQGEPGKDFVSLVATDNRRGGELGGEKLGDLLGGTGKVVLLRSQVGSASTDDREAGFAAAFGPFGKLGEKDLDAALETARSLGLHLPATELARSTIHDVFMNKGHDA